MPSTRRRQIDSYRKVGEGVRRYTKLIKRINSIGKYYYRRALVVLFRQSEQYYYIYIGVEGAIRVEAYIYSRRSIIS